MSKRYFFFNFSDSKIKKQYKHTHVTKTDKTEVNVNYHVQSELTIVKSERTIFFLTKRREMKDL